MKRVKEEEEEGMIWDGSVPVPVPVPIRLFYPIGMSGDVTDIDWFWFRLCLCHSLCL